MRNSFIYWRRMMKVVVILITYHLSLITLFAESIGKETMQRIYDEVSTPYKYGMVVAPADNYHKIDCPTVFREGNKWLMTYVCYNGKDGTDGRGYETWLAESDDLLHWQTLGRVLSYPADTARWDANQRGGFPALIDWTWGGSYEMAQYKGRHWMTYIGGHGTGYEGVREPLSIGMAWTESDITQAHEWQSADKSLLSWNDRDAQWWEQLIQYKSTIYDMTDISKEAKKAGIKGRFLMFYNAGGINPSNSLKAERIGIATSNDLKHWKRYKGNPVYFHEAPGIITGDAQIVKMDSLYVMFYFSAFNPTREYNAFNTFAVSRDLIHWQDWDGPDLIIPSKPYDEMFAHKSYVVKHDGVVYHYYCAVNNAGQRGIAVATSRHLGKSEVNFPTPEPTGHRKNLSLNDDWEVTFEGKMRHYDVPFNLDDYYGALQKMHGNLHGECVAQKQFSIEPQTGKQYFLRLEGVGTYADITLNGHQLGRFDIGRTTETINVTKHILRQNTLKINISHPAHITDMPWVCGGCSSEWGFSEGSQPFGIFRPVTLEVTDDVRIEPFGVHVWHTDSLYIETEVKNYGSEAVTLQLINKLCEKSGKQVIRLTDDIQLAAGETKTIRQTAVVDNPRLWSLESPYLYTVNTILKRNGKATESTDTPFGFRTVSWPLGRKDGDKRFMLNGKPVFINGICEYEHEFGASHAFTTEQIEARVKMVRDLGFNAFRDAHQPHNLHYQELLDSQGILWWPQFSAHIWYDTPEFRASFKRHLIQWVKERRNNPSNILWGLQNESTLPRDFAEECTELISSLDPTCGTQRLVTTCNGGEGTDWNVVQNWSGTYGGNVDNYGEELKQTDQLLNGEYGAWRTLGLPASEQAQTELLMKKVRLAESVSDSVCGQFLWLLNSHDNPGRRQPDEAARRIDKVGPFNHKGLISPWDQPVDAYYAYKAHYNPSPIAPARSEINERLLQPTQGLHYLYRINCGGDSYTDSFGNVWMQDNSLWSHSWAERFLGGSQLSIVNCQLSITPYSASQTRNDSLSSPLFQTSRFGRHELYYQFPADEGDYQVELYFIEPWYRTTDAEGFRIFDVAIGDTTVIHDLDIWAQAHYGRPYKRVVKIHHQGGNMRIHFPKVKAGQAIISAIAIASIEHAQSAANNVQSSMFNDQSDLWRSFDLDTLAVTPDSLLPPKANAALEVEGRVKKNSIEWTYQVGVAKVYALRFRYYNPEQPRQLHVKITDQNGVVFRDDDISFLQTQQKKTKRKMTSITTGTMTNAGTYRVVLTGKGINDMLFDKLTVE